VADVRLQAILSARDNTGGAFKSASMGVGKLAAGVALGQAAYMAFSKAVNLATGFIKSSIKAGLEAEDAQVKMAHLLKNSGKVTNQQIKSLQKWAETIQYKTGIDDESIKKGIGMLGTFKLQYSSIKKLAPVMLDLATAYSNATGEEMDLQHWAIMLGKPGALPELATNLRRIGIVLSKSQIEMMKMGNEEQRVAILTKELKAEFGGLAEKMGKTPAGRLRILNIAWGEFKEKIGSALIKGLYPMITAMGKLAQDPSFQKRIQDIATKVGELTTKAVNWITSVAVPWVNKHWPAIKTAIKNAYDKLVSFISKVQAFIDKYPFMATALGVISAALLLLSATRIPNTILAISRLITKIGLIPSLITIGLVLATADFYKTYNRVREKLRTIQGPWYIKIIPAMQEAFDPRKAGTPWFGNIPRLGALVAGLIKGKQSGGVISSTGQYMLHKGEIVKAQGTHTGGGGDVNVYITGPLNMGSNTDIDAFAKRLGRQIQLAKVGAL